MDNSRDGTVSTRHPDSASVLAQAAGKATGATETTQASDQWRRNAAKAKEGRGARCFSRLVERGAYIWRFRGRPLFSWVGEGDIPI